MQPYIEVEVLPLADMLNLIFRFSCHSPRSIEYLVAVLVKHGSFGATEIEFQIEARSSVFQFGLLQFGVLFVLAFYFRHK